MDDEIFERRLHDWKAAELNAHEAELHVRYLKAESGSGVHEALLIYAADLRRDADDMLARIIHDIAAERRGSTNRKTGRDPGA